MTSRELLAGPIVATIFVRLADGVTCRSAPEASAGASHSVACGILWIPQSAACQQEIAPRRPSARRCGTDIGKRTLLGPRVHNGRYQTEPSVQTRIRSPASRLHRSTSD